MGAQAVQTSGNSSYAAGGAPSSGWEPRIKVEGPEFFAPVAAKVREVRRVGEQLLVLASSDSGAQERYHMLNTDGTETAKGLLPYRAIGCAVLADWMKRNSFEKLFVQRDGWDASYTELSAALGVMGLHGGWSDHLASQLKALQGYGHIGNGIGITRESLATAGSTLLTFENRPYWLPKSKRLVFVGSGGVISLATTDGGGKSLAPESWQREEFQSIESAKRGNSQKQSQWVTELEGLLAGDSPGNGAITVERGILKVRSEKGSDIVYTAEASAAALSPGETRNLVFFSTGEQRIKRVRAAQGLGLETVADTSPAETKGEARRIAFDAGGNFILVALADGTTRSVKVLDADSLEELFSVPEMTEAFEFDGRGNLQYVDTSGRLRMLRTNFAEFSREGAGAAREQRKTELVEVGESLESLDLFELRPQKQRRQAKLDLSEDVLVERAQQKLLTVVKPLLDKAKTVEATADVADRIEALRSKPIYVNHPRVFELVDEMIRKQLDSIRAGAFEGQLALFKKELPELDTPAELPRLDQQFRALTQTRRALVVLDSKKRSALDKELERLGALVGEAHARVQGEVEAELERKLTAIREDVGAVGSLPELGLVQGEKAAVEFSELVSVVRDQKVRRSWMEKYRGVIADRRNELLREIEREDEQRRAVITQSLEECSEILDEVRQGIEAITERAELLAYQGNNPLINKYRTKLGTLPDEMRKVESEKLTRLIETKSRSLAARAVGSSAVGGSGNEAIFGSESFPIYKTPTLIWKAEVMPLNQGSSKGMLVYRSNLGRVYLPPVDPVPVDLQSPDTASAIKNTKDQAAAYFAAAKRRVPEFQPHWVVNEYHTPYLEKLARLFRKQLEKQRGVVILEGEAGTGKNVLLDLFGHFTDREVYIISCNAQAEKDDFTTAIGFDPQRGTFRSDSEFVRKLQTPGTIVVFDEVNSLPTGVAKMFNPLFGESRCLNLSDGRVVKVDPSVILAGAMNPQHYLGVKPLSPEIKTRARFVPVDYPPEKIGKGKSAYYEAEMMSKQVESLRDLSHDEFVGLWELVVNEDAVNGNNKIATPERVKAVKGLQQVVKSANRVREAHDAFRSGKSTEPVTLVFSLRESAEIASELDKHQSPKAAIKDVVLAKVADRDERSQVEMIIENS